MFNILKLAGVGPGGVFDFIKPFITDENVLGFIQSVHDYYLAECAKLEAGHHIQLQLHPHEEKGLILTIVDVSPEMVSTVLKEYCLGELNAENILPLVQSIMTPKA